MEAGFDGQGTTGSLHSTWYWVVQLQTWFATDQGALPSQSQPPQTHTTQMFLVGIGSWFGRNLNLPRYLIQLDG